MKNVMIEVPENLKILFEELASWEPTKIKKYSDNLIYYFAMMTANADSTENLDSGIAFTPTELQNLIFRLKIVSDAIEMKD